MENLKTEPIDLEELTNIITNSLVDLRATDQVAVIKQVIRNLSSVHEDRLITAQQAHQEADEINSIFKKELMQ